MSKKNWHCGTDFSTQTFRKLCLYHIRYRFELRKIAHMRIECSSKDNRPN